MPVDLTSLDGDGLPKGLLQNLALTESSGNDAAVSSKGAMGRFQLMPKTAAGLGVDPNDPAQNRTGAIKYLKQLYGQTGSWPMALAAYNEGPSRLQRSGVLPQTAGYVDKVLGMSDVTGLAPSPLMNPSVLKQLGIMPDPNDMKSVRTAAQGANAARADVKAQLPGVDAQLGQVEQGLSQPGPSVPTPPTLPPPPQDKYGDPKRVLGSFLPMMAILGGAMSHRHSLAAIQAATGAMEGAHQGDEDKIKLHHDQWMDSMSKLKTEWEQTRDEYEAAREKHGDNKANLMASLQVLSARTDNLLLKSTLANGDLDTAVKVLEGQRAAMEPLVHVYDSAVKQDEFRQTLAIKSQTIAPATQAYDAWLQANPGDTEGAARAAGAVNSSTHPARSASALATQRYLQDHPDASPEDIAQFNAHMGSETSATKAFATGKQGQALNSFNVGLSHLDTLGQLAEALDNGDAQAFNRLGNEIKTQTGSAAPSNFEAAKRIVSDEVVKAIVGGGGGVSDREEAAKTISAAKSPKQLAGVIDTYRSLMVGQLGGLKQQYEQTTGQKDFEKRLSPTARKYLDEHNASGATKTGKYKVGQIIDHGGKKYRVTGGDLNDPDVEPVT